MTDNEIIERYFKARGWEFSGSFSDDYNTFCWWFDNQIMGNYLPKILTDFPALAACEAFMEVEL